MTKKEEEKKQEEIVQIPTENFSFSDTDGRQISISSFKYDCYQLADLSANFLQLQPLKKNKKAPGYTE